MQWLPKYFDFTNGIYSEEYWDLTNVNYFVDSDIGSDTTGDGSENLPYATLTKAHFEATTGQVIFINGIFEEDLSISKPLRIIGIGGGKNAKAILKSKNSFRIRYDANVHNSYLENVEFEGYNTSEFLTLGTSDSTKDLYFLNVVFQNNLFALANIENNIYRLNAFFCIFKKCKFQDQVSLLNSNKILGQNSTLYNCDTFYNTLIIGGNNIHVNNDIVSEDSGSNNILNIDGNYFSPENNDFNFLNNSPLYKSGTFDSISEDNLNVGVGRQGVFINAEFVISSEDGGANLNNIVKDGKDLFRNNPNELGQIEYGIVDLSMPRNGVKLEISNSFEMNNGKLSKLIQTTNESMNRKSLNCEIIFGDTISEVFSKKSLNNWLLMELGKNISVSPLENVFYGNADSNFNTLLSFEPTFRYLKIRLTFKNS